MLKRTILLATTFCLLLSMNSIVWASPDAGDTKAVSMGSSGTALIPASAEFKEAVTIQGLTMPIAQWDMTAASKDRWHYARVIFFQDGERSSLEMVEQIELNDVMLGMISEMARSTIEKAAANNGARLLKWHPVERLAMARRNAIAFTAQMILTDKLPLPMYGNIHVFVKDKRLNVLALVCPDSDSEYWQPVFRQMAVTFQ